MNLLVKYVNDEQWIDRQMKLSLMRLKEAVRARCLSRRRLARPTVP